jgi:hypothetical protein
MKIADLLRRVADAVEQEQDPGRPDERLQNPAELELSSNRLTSI